MNDRELLEAAAKAAGLLLRFIPSGFGVEMPNIRIDDCPSGINWNPLADDGDALRLAVKKRMQLTVDDYGAAARIGNKGRWHGCGAHLYGGIEAATRHAIVRAAAAEAPKAPEVAK